MGLPLFIPPVESDVPSKSTAKGHVDPSHARSPIHRTTDRRRQLHEAREHRLRMLAALQARDQNTAHRARAPPQPESTTESNSRALESLRTSRRQSPRLENPRIAELNQRIEFGRRYLTQAPSRELAQDIANGHEDEDDDLLSQTQPMFTVHEAQPVRNPQPDEPPDLLQQYNTIIRYGPVEYTPSGLPARVIWRRENDGSPYHRRRRPQYMSQTMASVSAAVHRRAQRARYADGLGDRDRSLSPDADGVWDTLQSTLTPDPQPPSVGSSFASTALSATTQVNGTSSASTSMTTPNEEAEPPCDPPIFDDSGSDGDDDVREELLRLSQERTSQSRPSYADVVAAPLLTQSPELADASDPDREWLLGMHRIVRRLASRSDIPDDWWSQAGLSRSMSWDDSSN